MATYDTIRELHFNKGLSKREIAKRLMVHRNTVARALEREDNEYLLTVEKEALLNKRNTLANLAEQASYRQDRYSKTEIESIATINVREIQKEVDKLSKEYRELDTKIQGLNWLTDLI